MVREATRLLKQRVGKSKKTDHPNVRGRRMDFNEDLGLDNGPLQPQLGRAFLFNTITLQVRVNMEGNCAHMRLRSII